MSIQFLLKQLPNYVYLYILSSLLKYHIKLSLFESPFLSLSLVAYIIWCTNIILPLSWTSIQERVYTCFTVIIENDQLNNSNQSTNYISLCQYLMQTLGVKFAVLLLVIWWKYKNEGKSYSFNTVLVTFINIRQLWHGRMHKLQNTISVMLR